MWRRHAAFLLLVCVILAGVGASAAAPTGGGPVSCRVAWAQTVPAAREFDFSETYRHYRQRLPRQQCHKAWTVLIYMAADYDGLPEVAYRDLAEMERPFADPSVSAASTVDADVVVELDVRRPDGVRRLHMFRAPGQPRPGQLRSPVVEHHRAEDIAPERSLRDFVTWGVARYPAQHYLVVVWGHGLGWRPTGPAREQARWTPAGSGGGIAFDQSQRSVLDIPALHRALRAAGRPLDLYVSHACLMQSVEVTSELAPVARFVVGSEQVLGFVGLPYRSILPRVNGTLALPPAAPCPGPDTACRLAHLLPAVQQEAFTTDPEGRETYALSAVDTGVLTREVLVASRLLSSAIVAWLDDDPLNRIDLQEILATRDAGSDTAGSPGFRGGYRDFGVFLDNLSHNAALSPRTPATTRLLEAVRATREALDRAVVSAGFGTAYDEPGYDGKLGVSVWLPHDAEEFREREAFFAPAPFFRAGAADWLGRAFAPPS